MPIFAPLRRLLVEHRLRTGGDGFVFGPTPDRLYDTSSDSTRASGAWRIAGLTRITMHEARHTCASLMIAAGLNAKTVSTYLGHSSITVTLDRYGHLMPGNEAESVRAMDAYLGRLETGN